MKQQTIFFIDLKSIIYLLYSVMNLDYLMKSIILKNKDIGKIHFGFILNK